MIKNFNFFDIYGYLIPGVVFITTLVQIKFWGSLIWTALDRCYGPSTPP